MHTTTAVKVNNKLRSRTGAPTVNSNQHRITAGSKLRSQAGASITFALLLFLVCAVLSSVILVAATVAAGRMAGIAETDQNYYAVTSAAELIKDMVVDQEPIEYEKEGDASPYQCVTTGYTTFNKYLSDKAKGGHPNNAELVLACNVAEDHKLDVTIYENWDPSGDVMLTIESYDKKYKIFMTLKSDIKEFVYNSPPDDSIITTTKSTLSVSWSLDRMTVFNPVG